MSSRRVLITGVNRGLGRALAERFVERGHRVCGTSRSGDAPDGLESVTALDLGDEDSIVSAAEVIAGQTDALDLLINSAGTDARSFGGSEDDRGPFDLDADTFNAVLDVNVTGPMLVTRHLLPLIRRGDAPMIVNVSSQLGSMQVAARKGRDTAYCVSKAALNMVTVCTARELADRDIRSVAFHPGWVRTDMGGPSAALSPEESAAGILAKVDALAPDDNGGFFRWDGTPHPW